jgi:NMD protein affecting ribosome stability and mRNA decay
MVGPKSEREDALGADIADNDESEYLVCDMCATEITSGMKYIEGLEGATCMECAEKLERDGKWEELLDRAGWRDIWEIFEELDTIQEAE